MLEGGFDNEFSTRMIEPTAGALFTEPVEEPHTNRVGPLGARVAAVQPDPADEELSRTCRSVLDEIRTCRHPGVVRSAIGLSRELSRTDDLTPLALESLALDMIVATVRFGAESSEPGWLKHVDQMIGDTFRDPMSLAEMALEVGVHRAHLARAYKRHRGLPIATHLRQLRLEWAMFRVARTNESLSSIANRAGFADQSHLTREFKKEHGQPPGAYRRAHRASS